MVDRRDTSKIDLAELAVLRAKCREEDDLETQVVEFAAGEICRIDMAADPLAVKARLREAFRSRKKK